MRKFISSKSYDKVNVTILVASLWEKIQVGLNFFWPINFLSAQNIKITFPAMEREQKGGFRDNSSCFFLDYINASYKNDAQADHMLCWSQNASMHILLL